MQKAKRTLNATSQRCKRAEDPTLTRNYPTNDRMLRYKRIKEHFFMDTFFASKKSGKSLRGFTMMQLFVTDKGYIFPVPMKSKSEVPHAVKLFAKEVGAPDAIIWERFPSPEGISRTSSWPCKGCRQPNDPMDFEVQWEGSSSKNLSAIDQCRDPRSNMQEGP